MPACPCRHCIDRKPGCHASCGKYADWKTVIADDKTKYRKSRATEADAILMANKEKYKFK